jgi:hypothetical protein
LKFIPDIALHAALIFDRSSAESFSKKGEKEKTRRFQVIFTKYTAIYAAGHLLCAQVAGNARVFYKILF